jgi:outer membrane protein OmpA-like peptidoglycan-associated protein/tetratricopeptide (TPR) repeat protein
MRTSVRDLPLTLGALLMLASCASYQVRKGDEALSLLAYSEAQRHYDKALAHRADRGLLLHAAEACRQQNKLDEASAHYREAEKMAPLGGDDAFEYGRMLMSMGNYELAQTMFIRVINDQPERHVALELLGSCQGYRSFYSDSGRYSVAPLPITGVATAFSPVPYRDGLLFTGEQEPGAKKKDPWNGLSFLDLYYVPIDAAGIAGTPLALKGAVNGPYHEGSAVLSSDGHTLYFTRSNYYSRKLLKDEKDVSNLKLFRATLGPDSTWGGLQEFGYDSDEYSVGLPALSADGKTLYFVSDMPGGSGGTDLWYCSDNGTGWSTPKNMGPTINTAGDEMFPTIVGQTLYFSSTAHENMGGLDIFETHREGEFWSDPVNLGYPVNSTRDDLGLWLDSTGTHGYFSSARSGMDGLYSIAIHQPEFAIEGNVTDATTGEPIADATLVLKNLSTNLDTTIETDGSATFHLRLDANSSYSLSVSKDGMLSQSRPVSTTGLGISTTLRADLKMDPLVLDKAIAVQNIYYDYDQWDIRPDAALELDKLATVFLDNPGLKFELSSHTDSRGGDLYNLVLSDARAKSAVDYLVRHGVDPSQLEARGYGETQLVNGCSNGVKCTEEEHQANRRTEFKVISRSATATMR